MFGSDWVVQMTLAHNDRLNLALQLRAHNSIPDSFRMHPQGCSIAFVAPDVDAVFETAKEYMS